jgi:hypothetical protein
MCKNSIILIIQLFILSFQVLFLQLIKLFEDIMSPTLLFGRNLNNLRFAFVNIIILIIKLLAHTLMLLIRPFYNLFYFIIALYYIFVYTVLAVLKSLWFIKFDFLFNALFAIIYSTILLFLFLVSNFPYCVALKMILVATFPTDF